MDIFGVHVILASCPHLATAGGMNAYDIVQVTENQAS